MFLKKIKINGFKSFAKPIIIDFQSSITTIVGPNGSGKSNIVDAIRWALGEQSAKTLRGSKMSDVIFAGSKDYKPLKKASVTLYFDNSNQELPIEASEVRICRQVTEDGQSNYLINETVCRLKDIEELLMDTGMGKNAYSIVGQGKIDSILNSKPEKLRELFEEAAGISKHKIRKEEAEKRLEKTRHDLQRIKDLIWELDRQVAPLKKSAEKARKYKRLKEEMGILEVSLLLDRWEKNQNFLEKARQERDALQKVLKVLEYDLEEMTTAFQKKREELAAEEEMIENLKNALYQSRIKKEQVDNNLQVLRERNQGLMREKSSLKQVLNELEQEHRDLLAQQEGIDRGLGTVIEKDKALVARLDSVQSRLTEQKNLLEVRKNELFSRRNSILHENMGLKDLHAELEKIREKGRYQELEIEKMVEKRKGLSSQLNEVLCQQESMMKRFNEISIELEERHHNFHRLEAEEKQLQEKIAGLEDNIEDLNQELLKHKSRLQVLKDMESDLQGYFHGVKMILKAGSRFSGVIGVVADLISVEKEYEIAIETALGSRLQNIVVEDDTTARQCVDYLKHKNAGRATFLPLNMIRGDRINLEHFNLEKVDGFLGIAADFITCDRRLVPVINSLLGRTLLSRDLKSAARIAKLLKSKFRIVTLGGEVIHPGGAITGGSRNEEGKGLLGRSREIEELSQRVAELTREIAISNKKGEGLQKELKELQTRRDENKYRITNLEFQQGVLSKDIANLKNEQNRLEQELERLDKEFVESHERLGEIDNRKQKLQQQLQMVHDGHSREKEIINDMEEEVKRIEAQEQEINQKITDLRVELATVQQKKENLLNEKNRLTHQLQNNQAKMKETSCKLAEIDNKLLELKQREEELKEMRQDFSRRIEELEREYKERDQLYTDKERAVNELQNKYQKTQQDLSAYKEKCHKVELKITRLEDKNELLIEKLAEYQVNPEEGMKNRIEISNYNQANKKIKEFKSAMKSLEPVNPGAVQEYEELKERLKYLESQQQDLLEARNSITKIIREIEKNMGRMFSETFNKVKEEFEKIFKELFAGGSAELILTNPQDLLNTGVEIEAQPPGKQLKKLSLMSGGERALTAIALVFAFLQVNPSPIYILDEIDAPLDDANVIRFARFVKRYSSSVQFLIITHNKKMMTEADIIYGITMEEPGVSKLISLRLDEGIA